MCGICGFNWENRNLIGKMTSILEHRGPDDKGYYINKNISLGHRRLSIIDLNKGKQPIYNEDKSIVVMFNGEIYNYKELKKELKNHRFYTDTDTEVLVHLYEEYGPEFIKKLNGMFAFVIYDSNKKLLFIARDRLGIKPLYYYFNNKKFIFSSEIKSILLDKEIKREIDPDILNRYINFRYIPGEKTIFKNIKKLLPGHYLIYKNKKIITKKYWELNYSDPNILNKSKEYFIKNIQRLLIDSVKKRLMSDVPLGAYLSGGIDSSTIVALMHKLNPNNNIKTFSIDFGTDERISDIPNARLIANKFNTDHKEIKVTPKVMKIFPKVVWSLDEPIADPTVIPNFLLAKNIKKHITVVLTGGGADEVFGGYVQYKFLNLRNKINFIPLPIKNNLMPPFIKFLSKRIPKPMFKYLTSFGEEGIKRFIKFLKSSQDRGQFYLNIVSIFDENERKQIFTKNILKKINDFNIDKYKEEFFNINTNYLNQVLNIETRRFLSDNSNIHLDKVSMFHSIESRVPFQDHNLIEFIFKVPSNLKIRGFTGKYILRKAMRPYLPKQIIKRKKQGFFVPIDSWLEKDLKEMCYSVLNEKDIKNQGYFNYKYIQKIFNNYNKSKFYYARQLWNLIHFQVWHKIFIENQNYKKIKL